MRTVLKENTPVIINGEKYLTLPQMEKFTGINKGVLRQRLNRDTIDSVVIFPKYVFIRYDVCVELRDRGENDKKLEKFKELVSMDITVEELQRIIEERKNLKSSEGK